MLEDEEGRPRKPGASVRDLSRLSVGELEDYATRLLAEVERVRMEIEARRSVKSAAEAMFKKG